VRPFGAISLGIGDLVGRKYTFLVTMMVMGTFPVGLLATFAPHTVPVATLAGIGWLAPILRLRLLQGLAFGSE
jgi:MFS family permease